MKFQTLLFCTFSSIWSFAQTSSLTKKLLYTLQPHEIIYGDEALTSLKKNVSNFCLITYDTLSDKNSFVYNGKRMLTLNDSDYFWVETLNLNQNGFSLQYRKDGQDYLISNGTTIGPYEDIFLLRCEKTNELGYFYKLGSKYYFKVNNEKYGPFLQSHSGINLIDSQKSFLGLYNWSAQVTASVANQQTFEMIDNGGELTVLLNGKIIDTRRGLRKYNVSSGNSYGYLCDANTNYSSNLYLELMVNGVSRGNHLASEFKYDDIFFMNQSDCYYSKIESTGLHAMYKNDRVMYRNIKEIISYSPEGNILYKDANGYFYANNKKILSNDVDYLYSANIENENSYACYYFQDEKAYVKSSQGFFGPYLNVSDLKLTNGVLSFSFIDENYVRYAYRDGKINLNDVNLNFFDIQGNSSFSYGNHSFESSYEYNFVVIDGESFGKSPALQAWIDPVEKKFYWTALEKSEYVLYTYVFE